MNNNQETNNTEILSTNYPIVREKLNEKDNGFKRGDLVRLKQIALEPYEGDDFFVAVEHHTNKLHLLRVSQEGYSENQGVEIVNVNFIEPMVYGNVEENEFNAMAIGAEVA